MTTIASILDKMNEVYAGKPWYGVSVSELLNRVEPLFAFREIPHMPHCIASLAAHMIYWKTYVRDVLLSGKGERDQDASFAWKRYGQPGADTWAFMLADYNRLHQEITAMLEKLQKECSAELTAPVTGTSYTLGTLLEGIIDHDIYHIGQIVLLTRFFKAKDADIGA